MLETIVTRPHFLNHICRMLIYKPLNETPQLIYLLNKQIYPGRNTIIKCSVVSSVRSHLSGLGLVLEINNFLLQYINYILDIVWPKLLVTNLVKPVRGFLKFAKVFQTCFFKEVFHFFLSNMFILLLSHYIQSQLFNFCFNMDHAWTCN